MYVQIVGSGPAVEAVEAALSDVDATVESGRPADLEAADMGVVVAPVADDAFEAANDGSLAGDTPWLSVELGGVGGFRVPEVDAAVSGLGPETGCFDCLRQRVAANATDVLDEPSPPDDSVARYAGAIAGRSVATLVRGGEGPMGRVIEVPYAERRFLPVPGCSCSEPPDRRLSRGFESVDLEAAVERAERTLDDRVGIVQSIGEVESFPAPYYLASGSDTAGFSDASAPRQAGGVHADWNAAFMKAMGEALERYSAGVYRESTFRTAPLSAIENGPGPEVVRPDAFVRPDDFPPVDENDPVHWVPGADLAAGDEALLPAELVHYPPPAERHVPAITTGLGLGTSPVGALLSGLYEVVERDATMIAWYSTFDPLPLAVDDGEFETLARRARAEDLSVTPLLVTQDVDVPVVAAAVHRDGEWPRFAVGSAADLDPVAAAKDALAEALQNWMELRGMGEAAAAEESGAIGRYADLPREAREFVERDGAVPADSVGPDDPPTGPDELDALVRRVRDVDLAPYAARLTPLDVERAGFEAVRVLVPGAQPLFTDDPFFGDRARSVPSSLGFEPRFDRPFHPYP
ncbi:MAG: ribosomal protein S12 methylthiotransferase accessory factor [Natronomonas sp.]|jgi:ribosomal protein S12 methylthiotransferase accessory factor